MASVIPFHGGKEPPDFSTLNVHLCQSSGGIKNTSLEPWDLSFETLCEAFLSPAPVGEKDGTYFVRGPLKSGATKRTDANIERIELVVLDGDSSIDTESGETIPGAPPPLDTHVALIEMGIPHILYTTHSDGQADKGRRYRILVPTPALLPQELDAAVNYIIHGLHEAGCMLADVPENHRLSQPWFFPRVPDEKSEYLCYASDSGTGLDKRLVLEAYEAGKAPAKLPLEPEQSLALPRAADSLFAQFNETHGFNWIDQTLRHNGYTFTRTGNINGQTAHRYLSPHSSSGQPGVVLFVGRDGIPRVTSHHNANDPLSRTDSKATASDAWDVFRIFEHEDNQQAAIDAWRGGEGATVETLPELKSGCQAENIEQAEPLDPEKFPNVKHIRGGVVPLATVANVRHMMNCYGLTGRYNVTEKRFELLIPGQVGSPDNVENTAMTHVVSLAIMNGIPHSQVPHYIAAIADTNPYNPVVEYITSLPWDGKDRLVELYGTLTTNQDFPEKLKEIILRRWLISAVAAAFMPHGYRARGVLVLQGPQSIGKTSFFHSLIDRPDLRDRLIKLDHHMDAGDKDSIITAVSHWFVEIGELESSFKKDVARLKGFLTDTVDKVRRPYDRKDSCYPRRTVFCASVNSDNFLVDDTGNTRWWTIPVTSVNYQHGLNMQQVWAQVLELYNAGEQWWLTPEEEQELENLNKGHRAVNAVRDCLESFLDFGLPEGDRELMTATEVLRQAGFERPSNAQARDCGSYLREKIGPPTNSKGKTRWPVPMKKSQFEF